MIELTPLQPMEALAYFKAKGLLPSFAWQDVWQEEHARAFTVAKAMRVDILQDIRDALERALEAGTTLEQFKQELRPVLEAKGWWGKQQMVDPLTGEDRLVQLGSPRRLRTIFEVNMRTAYQAGTWQRVQETKAGLPFLRYEAIMDSRTRPEHRAWHGVIRPVDDPWWDTHYPPCGWRCRCTVSQLSAGQMKRRGWTVTENPPVFPPRTYVNPRSGEVTRVTGGIDAGWNYNVGKANLAGLTPSPLSLPGTDVGDAATATNLDKALFLSVVGAKGGRPTIVQDAAGDDLVVGPALFKDQGGREVDLPAAKLDVLQEAALALTDPDQIRRSWRQAANGSWLLMRRFFRDFEAEGRVQTVVVDWSAQGWWLGSSLEGLNIGALRNGPVIYQKPPGDFSEAA